MSSDPAAPSAAGPAPAATLPAATLPASTLPGPVGGPAPGATATVPPLRAGLRAVPFAADEAQNEALRLLGQLAFSEEQNAASWAVESARFEPRGLLALDTTDDDRVVGSNIQFTMAVSVPGPGDAEAPPTREVPTAGVSFVMVSPTQRRRGIAGALMRAVLTDLHERAAEPVAALWASEAAIYGRWGWGPATRMVRIRVPRRDGLVRAELAEDLVPRLVEPHEAAEALQALSATVRGARPGVGVKSPRWRAAELVDDPATRHGAGPLRCVLLCEPTEPGQAPGRPRAAALWAVRPIPGRDDDAGEVVVSEMFSDGPRSHAALWRWLTTLDLVERVAAGRRPVDDPVLDQLTDSRAAEVELRDGLWVRLVDVDRALTARGYAGDVDAVLELADDVCPWNAGRWRFTVTDGRASVTRTEDPADLALDVRVLACAYLGDADALGRLGRAGLVTVRTPGVLGPLSRAFTSAAAPWHPTVF